MISSPPPLPRVGRSGKIVMVVVLSLIYALIARLTFASAMMQVFDGVVSFSFLFVTPFVMGALCVLMGYRLDRPHAVWLAVVPIFTAILGLLLSLVTKLEAAICVLMASPILVGMSLLGALAAHFLFRWQNRSRLHLSFLVLLPYVFAPLEKFWEQPQEEVTITDSILIRANPETIWTRIASVSPIAPEELPNQPIYHLGFPKPIAATLDHAGVGGKRLATFERQVSFFEEITVWERPHRLTFTIYADPAFIPHTAFDQHIIVGGRFYDVLEGTYEIIPEDGGCRLQLTSRHRLSTRFNAYAGWWSEWIMRQIQGSILEVIRKRCEAA